MNVVTNERQDDLEKFTWTFVEGFEEEKIQLLEDSSIGKLSYFFVPYFSQKQWILDIVVSLGCTSIALSTQLMYFFLCENIYPGFEVDVSGIFSASWLIIYCSLHHAIFVANYIYCKVTVDIEMDSLQKLLEEVAEIDLAGDPEPWRRIAFRVNCWFAEDKFNNPIFYSGKQCRRFFVRDILRPMDPEPYKIGWFFEGKLIKTYCEDVLSRMLAQKAIANYRKNYPEEFDDLSEIDSNNDRSDRLFEKLHRIIMAIVLGMVLIEFATIFILGLASIIVCIYYAISNASSSPNFK
ncbi:hypothetical protein BZL39_M05330 [Zygosaccharomyces parabailii]|nr:hypothetical protein BZL39_M05330 [Zygosaccharomyces parabailii]